MNEKVDDNRQKWQLRKRLQVAHNYLKNNNITVPPETLIVF